MPEFKDAFESPYEYCGYGVGDCSQFNGKPFTVVREITEPEAGYDAEVLPMYEITCDGVQFSAWPEEVTK